MCKVKISCNSPSRRNHEICTITSTPPNTLSPVVYFILYFSLLSLWTLSGPWPGGICFPSPCVTERITQQTERGTSWARSMLWTVKFIVVNIIGLSAGSVRKSSPASVFVSTVRVWCWTRVNILSLSVDVTASSLEGEAFHLSAKHKYKGSGNDVKTSETKRAICNLFVFSCPIYETISNLSFFSTYVCPLVSSVRLRKFTSFEMRSPSTSILSEGV